MAVDGPTLLTEGTDYFTIVRGLDGVALPIGFKEKLAPHVKFCQNERMLLSYFMGTLMSEY